MRGALPLLALIAVGAAAPADPFAGRVPVATERCVARSGNEPIVIVDDRTLLYDRVGKRLWRNDLRDRCPGMDPDDILIVETYGAEMCENDLIRPLSRGSTIPGPVCRLGKFTAYEKLAS